VARREGTREAKRGGRLSECTCAVRWSRTAQPTQQRTAALCGTSPGCAAGWSCWTAPWRRCGDARRGAACACRCVRWFAQRGARRAALRGEQRCALRARARYRRRTPAAAPLEQLDAAREGARGAAEDAPTSNPHLTHALAPRAQTAPASIEAPRDHAPGCRVLGVWGKTRRAALLPCVACRYGAAAASRTAHAACRHCRGHAAGTSFAAAGGFRAAAEAWACCRPANGCLCSGALRRAAVARPACARCSLALTLATPLPRSRRRRGAARGRCRLCESLPPLAWVAGCARLARCRCHTHSATHADTRRPVAPAAAPRRAAAARRDPKCGFLNGAPCAARTDSGR
jgi:hypothetical protein